MIEIILYIYFAFNLVIIGRYLGDVFNEDDKWLKVRTTVFFLFFAVILVIYYYFAPRIKIFTWIRNEIRFKYRLYFTDYWDKVLLDDNYSEDYPTLSKKIERMERLIQGGSKQLKRHNKIIQEKYGK